MSFFAFVVVCAGAEALYKRYNKPHYCNDEYCSHSEYIDREIYFHNTEDGKGYVFNRSTGKKLIRHIAWIANPLGKDTLVCFSDGKKRGYFSKNTGKVVIDQKLPYIPNMQGYVFHGGYCVVDTDDGEQCGLMDKKGNKCDRTVPCHTPSSKKENLTEKWLLGNSEQPLSTVPLRA